MDEAHAFQAGGYGERWGRLPGTLIYSSGTASGCRAKEAFRAPIPPQAIDDRAFFAAMRAVDRSDTASVVRLLRRAVANAEVLALWYRMEGDEPMATLYTQIAACRRQYLQRLKRGPRR